MHGDGSVEGVLHARRLLRPEGQGDGCSARTEPGYGTAFSCVRHCSMKIQAK